MVAIETFLEKLTIQNTSKERIREVLNSLDQDTVSAWTEKVAIKDGKVAGTYYADIGSKLSFIDFVDLYKSLGYDFDQMSHWKDHYCGFNGCERFHGYSCNTKTC